MTTLDRVPAPLASFTALVAGAALAVSGAAVASAPHVPMADLMKEIRKAQRADFEAWGRHSFERRVVRERLDDGGATVRREVLEFRVSPARAGFDELLVRIDGRAPLSYEVREHRRAGRFEKHYGRVRAGQDVDEEEGFSLAWLTQFPAYRIVGSERVRGHECDRLEFGPGASGGDAAVPSRVPRRFVEVMAGTLCVTRDGHHLVSAEARTLAPVPMTFGIVRIQGLEIELDGDLVAPGTWLPTRILVESHLSILGRDVRKRNHFTYSGYRPADRR